MGRPQLRPPRASYRCTAERVAPRDTGSNIDLRAGGEKGCGAGRIRTDGLLGANQTLSQLSYSPTTRINCDTSRPRAEGGPHHPEASVASREAAASDSDATHRRPLRRFRGKHRVARRRSIEQRIRRHGDGNGGAGKTRTSGLTLIRRTLSPTELQPPETLPRDPVPPARFARSTASMAEASQPALDVPATERPPRASTRRDRYRAREGYRPAAHGSNG